MPGETLTAEQQALNGQLSQAFQQMHALNVSITTERARGNVAGVAAMLPLYKQWLDTYRTVSAKLGQTEQLSAFERFYTDSGDYVRQALDAIPDATGALPQAIFGGIVKAAAPYVAAYVAWLWIRGKL